MSKTLLWLRNDLRLADNPALAAALEDGGAIALYIHETDPGLRPPGAAARWWLHQSLAVMARSLASIGVSLRVERGRTEQVLMRVLADSKADIIHWNRRYAPAECAVDAHIKAQLRDKGFAVTSHPGNVLVEPWLIQTRQGRPYSVYTPFWRALSDMTIARPRPAPDGKAGGAPRLDTDYRPPRWSEKLGQYWQVGEAAAQQRLADFLDQCLAAYPEGRDFPARDVTSRLSPHLRFGEISARQVWHAAKAFAQAHPDKVGAVEKFLSELAWRDFSYHQLFHRDDIARVPMQAKYGDLAWRHAPAQLKAWQAGQTGFPIIDAGMRELWETGYMHNRVRMLVASFLTKNLLIDWRQGEAWFWDCLVDADIANNPASWQWVAGSGLDAAPYFRIFNPVTQGERFDAAGDYLRRWVPELAGLPDEWIHKPFEAPEEVLKKAGIALGETYPRPLVDLKSSRKRALEAVRGL